MSSKQRTAVTGLLPGQCVTCFVDVHLCVSVAELIQIHCMKIQFVKMANRYPTRKFHVRVSDPNPSTLVRFSSTWVPQSHETSASMVASVGHDCILPHNCQL